MSNQDNLTYTCTTDVAKVYKMKSSRPGWGWANITIREWPGGGSVDVQSDFGGYAYSWGAIGTQTFRAFLRQLNCHYFMGKAAANRGRVFSWEEAKREIRWHILESRNDQCITKDQARVVWNDLDEAYPQSESELHYELNNGALTQVGAFYDYDGESVPYAHEDCPQARAFWDGPWTAVCKVWAEEVE